MERQQAVKRDEPIRLFKSDFLEFFSHISPVAVAAIWAPVFLGFLYLSIREHSLTGSLWVVPIGVFSGWFVWTFVEYTLHRYIFHYHPKTERLKKMFFVVHGVHHAQPMCRTRLVMPPALSVPLSFGFYGLFYLVLVVLLGIPSWFNAVFAGVIGGYLIYDLTHYAIHHVNVTEGWFFKLRKHHLRHHGACSFLRYGVSTTFWDHVFGTMPKADCSDLIKQRREAGLPIPSYDYE